MRFPRPIVLTDVEIIQGEDLHKDAGLVQQEGTPDSYSGDAGSNPASGWTGCDRCSSAYVNHLELISVCFKCHATLCPTCMGKGSICPPCADIVKQEEFDMTEELVDIEIEVDDDLYASLKEAADLDGVTLSELASQAITEYVERLIKEESESDA